VETLNFGECNCEVAVLGKGTLELERKSGTDNATVRSTGTEITISCSTAFGPAHCIYKTNGTGIGTLEGGMSAAILTGGANIPHLTTSFLCTEKAEWDATYVVTKPRPLYVEPEAEAAGETILCAEKATQCPFAKAYGVGTEVSMSLVAGTKTKLKNGLTALECSKSSLTAKVTAVGEKASANIEGLSFEECGCTEFCKSCELKVLSNGTLEFQHINSTDNATARVAGTEVTTNCNTFFGTIHCISSPSDLGTLEGGSVGKLKAASLNVPQSEPSPLCTDEVEWTAEYEVASPKPLYMEPEMEDGTVLCAENVSPCRGKAYGNGTEVKASLVSKTKSKLTTPYNNIECGKSSLTSKVTSTGKTIGASVEALTLEECNCEVKVLAKGTLELEHIVSTTSATMKSTGTEVTTKCETIFGPVHCIYKTEATDLGTLEGGNPAKIKISGANVPFLATDTRCSEGTESAKWDAEYEVTSPKPLFIEPR